MTRRDPDPDNIPSTQRTDITEVKIGRGNKAANNEFMACQFILGADNSRYKNLEIALANQFVFGNDDYPKDTT